MLKKNSILWILLFYFVFGCTPSKKRESSPEVKPVEQLGTYMGPRNSSGQHNSFSLGELQRELSMDRENSTLGYMERSFNTCQVQSNRSSSPRCVNLFYSSLNIKLGCRNNSGVVRSQNLVPLQVQSIRWKSGRHGGLVSTDALGFGQIRFVSHRSIKHSPMTLYVGSRMLYKRLKDSWGIVLPRKWCASPP